MANTPCKGSISLVWEADIDGSRHLIKKTIDVENIGAISRNNLGNMVYNSLIDAERAYTAELRAHKLEQAELAANQAAIAQQELKTEPPKEEAIELSDDELEQLTAPNTEDTKKDDKQLELGLDAKEPKEPSLEDLKQGLAKAQEASVKVN